MFSSEKSASIRFASFKQKRISDIGRNCRLPSWGPALGLRAETAELKLAESVAGHDPVHIPRVFRRRRHGAGGARNFVALPVRQRLRREKSFGLRSQLGRGRHQARRRRRPRPGRLARAASTSRGPPFPARTFRSPGAIAASVANKTGPDPFGHFLAVLETDARPRGRMDRAPRTIVLENVHGCLTSHGGKGLCGDRIRAGGFRLQIRSGGDQRLPFRSAITAARFFHCRPEGGGDPGFADRREPPASMASGRADRGLRRHDRRGETELGLVGYSFDRPANFDFRSSSKRIRQACPGTRRPKRNIFSN